jgi:two-component system, cell cycle response regulator
MRERGREVWLVSWQVQLREDELSCFSHRHVAFSSFLLVGNVLRPQESACKNCLFCAYIPLGKNFYLSRVSYFARPHAGVSSRISPGTIMISPEEILRAKILLVDDCEDNLFTIAESLRMAGYTHVDTISNPRDVRSLHEQNNYDLIVLDMQMPHMDGLEVMESLLDVEKTPYLPVLTITGNSDYKIAALKAGARDFLTKPYDLTELHQRIHNLLEVRLLYKSVSEQNRVQQELALRDPLTNLPNRRLLLDRLEKAIQRASRDDQSVALFFLDLDGFKQVNDVHGHPVGDMLLKTVAQRLQNMTREHDTVARLGGDEFVMLISGIAEPADAVRPATDALSILSQPYKINDLEVHVTASIGIAFYPAHGHDAESLIAHADRSLYDAKRSGKNRFHLAKVIEQSSAAV